VKTTHAFHLTIVCLLMALVFGWAVQRTPADPSSGRARTVAVIAHRGAHQCAPENTLPAFQAAIDLGVDYVELDVHQTADSGLVVIHDSRVDRVTDGSGAVREMTLAQIRALDAGIRFGPSFAGTRIPTADEALALMKGKVGVYLEVKDAPPESIVALLRRHDMFSTTIVYDDAASLAAMKRVESRIRAMVPRMPKELDRVREVVAALHPAVFGSSSREISPEVAEACHAVGAMVFVNVLAADAPEGWMHAIRCGADALETDHPAELVRYLREQGLRE